MCGTDRDEPVNVSLHEVIGPIIPDGPINGHAWIGEFVEALGIPSLVEMGATDVEPGDEPPHTVADHVRSSGGNTRLTVGSQRIPDASGVLP